MRQAHYFYVILFALFSNANHSYAGAQSLSSLEKAAKNFLQIHYREKAEKIIITVSRLDARLRLESCLSPPSFTVRDNAAAGGAISLKAVCLGEKPWSLYMAAHAALHHQIVVAVRPLARGEVIQSEDITTELLDTSTLRNGYLTNTEFAVGKLLKHPLRIREPLRQGVLTSPIAVKRGQTVRLEVISGSITVAAKAIALTNGRIGESVRVRNISSKRVVNAEVVENGRVMTTF